MQHAENRVQYLIHELRILENLTWQTINASLQNIQIHKRLLKVNSKYRRRNALTYFYSTIPCPVKNDFRNESFTPRERRTQCRCRDKLESPVFASGFGVTRMRRIVTRVVSRVRRQVLSRAILRVVYGHPAKKRTRVYVFFLRSMERHGRNVGAAMRVIADRTQKWMIITATARARSLNAPRAAHRFTWAPGSCRCYVPQPPGPGDGLT